MSFSCLIYSPQDFYPPTDPYFCYYYGMNQRQFIHSVLIGVAIVATFLWANHPGLSHYNLQLTGALIILYFVFRLIFSSQYSSPDLRVLPTTIVLTTVTLLLLFATGGVSSQLFFLLDFLLFALALLFEPVQAAVATAILVTLFLLQNQGHLSNLDIINIASLTAMTPLAIIFSRLYLKYLQSIGKIKVLEQAIHEEETESLLWISRTAKPSVASVLNSVSDIVIYFNTIKNDHPTALSEKLKAIQSDLITLYTSTGELETVIKTATDKINIEAEDNGL